jgi:Na+/melibiose symporter-like transporter
MQLWEQVVVGAIGLLMLFLFLPGVRNAIAQSKQAQQKHWGTVIMLSAIVVLFVLLLISLVQ